MKKSGSSMTDLKQGKRMNPPGDSGMRPGKGSVNDGATRDSASSAARTLGPREA